MISGRGRRQDGSHEDFARPDEVKGGSDRAFGLTVGGVLILIGALRWLFSDGSATVTAALAGAGALLVLAGLVVPALLAPLNRIWLQFGLLLHRITSPLIMAFLFYLTITPIALLMRLFGKDPLRRKFEPEAQSYWIEREPPGPAPDSMKQQF